MSICPPVAASVRPVVPPFDFGPSTIERCVEPLGWLDGSLIPSCLTKLLEQRRKILVLWSKASAMFKVGKLLTGA
jgi:hypothetical protein